MNAVVVPLEPTATVAGTVKNPVLLDNETVAPPVLETVIVQVELEPDPRLDGMHVRPVTTIAVTSEIVAVCVLPLRVAVTVAV